MGAVDGECLRARVFETEGARERECVCLRVRVSERCSGTRLSNRANAV